MSLKCDSCSRSFPTAVNLFEHIQQSCLAFYKSHPLSWTKILSSLTPDEESSKVSQNTRKKASLGSSRVSTPSPSSTGSSETPPLLTQTKVQKPLNTSNNAVASTSKFNNAPLVCKCEASFKSREEFKEHLKTCAPGKEPPFCIMFRAQETEPGKALKNVHMTVSDYFYGSIPGKTVKLKKISRRCNCYSCGKTLRNNIRFMSHLRHKVFNEWEKKEQNIVPNICQHCYRQYDSPFLLQCHLENVHTSVPAACSCRICELHFTSERAFLFHMKDKHVHNETPYVCKVCMYKSSYYNDVIKHFRDEHVDTTALMCPFCLAVAHNSSALLKHVIQHIKKGADCARCRLKFVNAKERAVHNQFDHSSNCIPSKLKKHKNLNKCQVYVRVTSFQMTQRQQMLQKANDPAIMPPSPASPPNKPDEPTRRAPPKRSRQALETTSEPPPFKKALIAQSESQLPNYLNPLKRSAKIKKVRIPDDASISVSSHRCAECRASLSIWNNSFADHFKSTYECKWCVFSTCCENAANKHVLREHADADLREQLLGKSEETKTAIETVSLEDDDVTIIEPDVKTEPNDLLDDAAIPVPPQLEVMEDKAQKPNSSKTKESETALQPKPRRKQSNPMRIADGVLKSPKRVQKEKKVQTKSFEKEKGIQTSDKEFENVEIYNGEKSAIVQKEFRRPGIKIQNKPKPPPKNRKILAPEGFFPDIDDDDGWAKYFQECEGTSWKPGNSKALQSVQPKTVSNQRTPAVKTDHRSTGKEKFILPATSVSQPNKNNRNSSQMPSLSVTKAPVPGVTLASSKGKTRPVYQFQLVPNTKQLVKPATPQPITCLFNQVQNMINRVPHIPVDLRCLEVTHSSLLIQWEAPRGAVTEYKVVFQGSGAPTVQLLPPEQTLVRLVGLKSDTMYVVRVYTLNQKSVSHYAFLYQKTNALRRKSDQRQAPADDDVVLVLDDNESAPKSLPPPLSKAPVLNSLNTKAVKPSMPSMSHAVTRVTNSKTSNVIGSSQISNTDDMKAASHVFITKDERLLLCPSTETLSETGQPVLVVQPEAPEDDSQTNSISLPLENISSPADQSGTATKDSSEANAKEHLNKEKSEKMLLLNELLAGLNKKKIGGQKSKIAKVKPIQVATSISSNALFLPVSSSDKKAASAVQTIILTPVKLANAEKASIKCHNTAVGVADVKKPSSAPSKNGEDKRDVDTVLHASKSMEVTTEMTTATVAFAGTNEVVNKGLLGAKNANMTDVQVEVVHKNDKITSVGIVGDTVKTDIDKNEDHAARSATNVAVSSREQEEIKKDSANVADSSLVTFQSSSAEVDDSIEAYDMLDSKANAHESDHVKFVKDSDQSDITTPLDGNEAGLLTKCSTTVTLAKVEVTVHQSDTATEPTGCSKHVGKMETNLATAESTAEDASGALIIAGDKGLSNMVEQKCEPVRNMVKADSAISPTLAKEKETSNLTMSTAEDKFNIDSTDAIPKSSVTQLVDHPVPSEEIEMEVNIVNVVSLSNPQNVVDDADLQVFDGESSLKSDAPDIEGLNLARLEEDKQACQLKAGLSGTVASGDSATVCLTNSQIDKSASDPKNHDMGDLEPMDIESLLTESDSPDEVTLVPSSNSATPSTANVDMITDENASPLKVCDLNLPRSPSPPCDEMMDAIVNKLPKYDDVNMDASGKLNVNLQQCDDIGNMDTDDLKPAKVIIISDEHEDKDSTLLTDSKKQDDSMIKHENTAAEDKDSMVFPDSRKQDDSLIKHEDTAVDIDTNGMQIEDAINKELLNLESNILSSADNVYGDGPTLDDIKDIMEEDLPWL